MPSKRFFFNKTLFGKHLSRFWPLWGIVSLVGAMFPLYVQLALMQQTRAVADMNAMFRESLYQIAAGFVPAFTCVYAIFCVMAVWGYLYNARSVGLMHTLPVDRTCLFVTNTLAAIAMQLIPFAVTGGLICLIALGWGFFDLIGVLNTVLVVLFCTLLFTGMATLCAMLTGHSFVLPVFYLLANILAFTMEVLITNLAHEFLLGVPMMEDIGRLIFLSPVVEIYKDFEIDIQWVDGVLVVCRLQGLWVVALYALAGLGLLALGWFLYRRRHSESAGDVVAFRWLRPVFRYGVALLSGLTIGRLLYELLWGEIFQKGDYAEVLPMAVCIFLAGLIGYYAASMLLEKSRRVFGKKSLPGVGVVAAGTVALCLLVSVDVFGLVRKVPALDEIETVTISDDGDYSTWSASEDPEQVRALLDFHQAIVDDRDYIRSLAYDWAWSSDACRHHVVLEYQLTDGTTLRRTYGLWLTRDRVETAGTYDHLLEEFYKDPAVRLSDVTVLKGARLEDIDIFCNYADGSYINANEHSEDQQICEALQKDVIEGNIPAKSVLDYPYESSRFYLRIWYLVYNEAYDAYHNYEKTVYMTPSMTNTLDVLMELGYLTEENVESWSRDLAERAAEDEAEMYGGVIYPETSTVYVG